MYRLGCDDNKAIPSNYNRVWVQDTWGPKQPLMYLPLDTRLYPSLKIGFLNQECFLEWGQLRFGRIVIHISVTSVFHGPELSINSLGPSLFLGIA